MARGSKDQEKVTSKLQVALPTHIATLHGISPSDEIQFEATAMPSSSSPPGASRNHSSASTSVCCCSPLGDPQRSGDAATPAAELA